MNDGLSKEGAIATAAQGLLAIIDPAEVRNELAGLAVPQKEVKGLESALAACRESDNTDYNGLKEKEEKGYLEGATWLTKWYKKRRFRPSVEKTPSPQTRLIETTLKISKDLQDSVTGYGQIPETIAHMANEYKVLEVLNGWSAYAMQGNTYKLRTKLEAQVKQCLKSSRKANPA